jgi:hypothetical protein
MFRDGAYKALTQGWTEYVGDSVAKVILKADGAELFMKPTIPGEIPYVTDDNENEESSDDGLAAAAAAAAQSGLTQAGSPPQQTPSPLDGSMNGSVPPLSSSPTSPGPAGVKSPDVCASQLSGFSP